MLLLVAFIQAQSLQAASLEAYCWPYSGFAGEQINFYFSGTDYSNVQIFKVEFRNNSFTNIPVSAGGSYTIVPSVASTNANCVVNGCGWQSASNTLTITINSAWSSGYYIAKFEQPGDTTNFFSVPFIVKKTASAATTIKKTAMVANTLTWSVYNDYNGAGLPNSGSIYSGANPTLLGYTNDTYSFMRPNAYSLNHNHLFYSEVWVYTWLNDNGFEPQVYTDIDIHNNTSNFLSSYHNLVLAGHPEYWTGQMYDNIKLYQSTGGNGSGGNLICLGGNACFEVVDINITDPNNPKLNVWPQNPNCTLQNNLHNPMPPYAPAHWLGSNLVSSPYLVSGVNSYDRTDFFLESYNFGTVTNPVYKRSVDLIGTHYQVIKPCGTATVSTSAPYELNTNVATSNLFSNVLNPVIGTNSYYNYHIAPYYASSHETDQYTPSPSGFPFNYPSVYDGKVIILAKNQNNAFTTLPPTAPEFNGCNASEIIYIPAECGAASRGYVFTAGSIGIAGSLIDNYNNNTTTNNKYDNDLSRLVFNVLQLDYNAINNVVVQNVTGCANNTNGSVTFDAHVYGINNYTISNGISPDVINGTPSFNNLASGIYTISCTGGNACVYTTSITISQPPSITITASATDILCNGGTTNITLTTYGGTGIINTSPSTNNLIAGTYTFTATDVNNCTGSTVVTITQPAILSTTLSLSDVSCIGANDGSIYVNNIGGTAGYTITLTDATMVSTTTTGTNATFTGLAPGLYIVSVVDANGCSTSNSNINIQAPSNAYCCNTAFSSAIQHILVDNIASSSLPQATYSNASLFINGTFTVDNNFTLNNCKVYFTANASIVLQNNMVLTMNNCTLQAGCGAMWDGIYADDASEQIVLDGCTISDMENGIFLQNLAKINATANTFTNNYKCMFFINNAGAYNSTIGNCIVRKNVFTDNPTINLLPPKQNHSKTETAITIFWCNEVQIGYLDPNNIDPTDVNTFDGIYNGILVIKSNNTSQSQRPLFYNNQFNNIHKDDISTVAGTNYLDKLNNIYQTHHGAGIFVTDLSFSPQTLNNNNFITVNNYDVSNSIGFNNCDKAIVTTKCGAIIKNTYVDNTAFAFMNSSTDGQDYRIGDQIDDNTILDNNQLLDVHYGIQLLGNYASAYIGNNIIESKIISMPTANQNIYPVAIDIRKIVNDVWHDEPLSDEVLRYGATNIRQNVIDIKSALGTGIQLANTSNNTYIDRNTINLSNNLSPVKYGIFGTRDYIGIDMQYGNGGTLIGNHINGPSLNNITTSSKLASAVKLNTSPNIHFECNHLSNTRNGFWVQDYCQTATTDIINNDWNHHFYGILFTPIGADGTFGDMGQPTTDYNFNFAGNYDNDANQADADRLFRVVSGNNFVPQPTIYTNNITQAQSGSNIAGFEYQVDNTSNPVPACSPIFSLVPAPNGGAGTVELNEAYANQLIHDSITFYANPTVAQWLAELRLYESLVGDSNALNESEVLETFFESQENTAIDYITRANLSIDHLIDPTCLEDSLVYESALINAKINNNGIPIENQMPYIQNESTVNAIYLKTVEYGNDSLRAEDKQWLEDLAKSCPLINGSAVYKARSIWANYEPWVVYNDLLICNNIGQNKNNSTGPYDFVLENLEDSTANNTIHHIPIANEFTKVAQEVKRINSFNCFSLSPNPAQQQITIKYKLSVNDIAQLKIFNYLGQEVQQIELPSHVETVTAGLNNVSNGLYTYQYIVNGKLQKTDKLIIFK
jgi:parallel beta-helix repeat protein